jgi:hypothetical protein
MLGRANQSARLAATYANWPENVRVFLSQLDERGRVALPKLLPRRRYAGWRKPGSRRAFVATRISLRRLVSISRVTSSCPALRCVHC